MAITPALTGQGKTRRAPKSLPGGFVYGHLPATIREAHPPRPSRSCSPFSCTHLKFLLGLCADTSGNSHQVLHRRDTRFRLVILGAQPQEFFYKRSRGDNRRLHCPRPIALGASPATPGTNPEDAYGHTTRATEAAVAAPVLIVHGSYLPALASSQRPLYGDHLAFTAAPPCRTSYSQP